MIKFLQAVFILSGMIIGVGMFGIPFSFVRAGFWLGVLELILLTSVVLLMHIFYGEIVLRTPEFHRLPGYVRLYLGSKAAVVSWFSTAFGIPGALLVYVILGSLFLNNIASVLWTGSYEFFWVLWFAAAGSVITVFSLKKETLINGILTVLLTVFIFYLAFTLFPWVKMENFSGFKADHLFVPYGVLLFALSGGVVIPDLVTFLGRDRVLVRRAILVGTVLPALVYLLFAAAVVGVSGSSVSPEAINGLGAAAGGRMVFLGSVIGFLAAFTSFIVLGKSFQSLLRLDLGFSKTTSWLVVSLIPPALYFFGLKNFISIMGAVGAVAVGTDSFLTIAAYSRLRVLRRENAPFYRYFVYAIILGGVLYELSQIFG